MTHQAVVRSIVERQRGAGLQVVQLHKVPHILEHVHALGVGAVQPKPACPAKSLLSSPPSRGLFLPQSFRRATNCGQHCADETEAPAICVLHSLALCAQSSLQHEAPEKADAPDGQITSRAVFHRQQRTST